MSPLMTTPNDVFFFATGCKNCSANYRETPCLPQKQDLHDKLHIRERWTDSLLEILPLIAII